MYLVYAPLTQFGCFVVHLCPLQGRITQVKQKGNITGIATKCQYHHNCSVLRSAKAFPADPSQAYDRIMGWLYEGRDRVPDMNNGFAHKQLFGATQLMLQHKSIQGVVNL